MPSATGGGGNDAAAGEDASIVWIWPEHFDAAIDAGDGEAGRIDTFFDAPGFKGVDRTRTEFAAEADPRRAAIAFLREARQRSPRTGMK